LLHDLPICRDVERPHHVVSDELFISIVEDNEIETFHGYLLSLLRVFEFPMMVHYLAQLYSSRMIDVYLLSLVHLHLRLLIRKIAHTAGLAEISKRAET
jgi:succinate-acetate transporter protein